MKRLFFVVEGQTEQEFVNTMLRPWFQNNGIFDVNAVLIKTSRHGRGGHVNAEHLINTINGLLKETADKDLVVTTFIDFFRIPTNMPGYAASMSLSDSIKQVDFLEKSLASEIKDRRFIPYIQRHEFEALVFSSNAGFEKYCSQEQSSKTSVIVDAYDNPEDINSSPSTAPSKRILSVIPEYNKVLLGNIIALEIGLDVIMSRCPRFAAWINNIIKK